jgi:DNA-binding NtrC family response regulator
MAKATILLVEDHDDTALVTANVLRRAGYDVAVAHSIDEAERHCRDRTYDLLISDLRLPDGSGVDLLRAAGPCAEHNAIAVSAAAMEDDVSSALRAGFRAHLRKPVALDRLLHAVERALAN